MLLGLWKWFRSVLAISKSTNCHQVGVLWDQVIIQHFSAIIFCGTNQLSVRSNTPSRLHQANVVIAIPLCLYFMSWFFIGHYGIILWMSCYSKFKRCSFIECIAEISINFPSSVTRVSFHNNMTSRPQQRNIDNTSQLWHFLLWSLLKWHCRTTVLMSCLFVVNNNYPMNVFLRFSMDFPLPSRKFPSTVTCRHAYIKTECCHVPIIQCPCDIFILWIVYVLLGVIIFGYEA